MEDPVLLGLAELEHPHWGHIDYRSGVNGRRGSYEENDVYNGRKCYK